MQDSLSYRQRACDIANALWGVGMSCEVNECAMDMDLDLDGEAVENLDQSGVQGDQP